MIFDKLANFKVESVPSQREKFYVFREITPAQQKVQSGTSAKYELMRLSVEGPKLIFGR